MLCSLLLVRGGYLLLEQGGHLNINRKCAAPDTGGGEPRRRHLTMAEIAARRAAAAARQRAEQEAERQAREGFERIARGMDPTPPDDEAAALLLLLA